MWASDGKKQGHVSGNDDGGDGGNSGDVRRGDGKWNKYGGIGGARWPLEEGLLYIAPLVPRSRFALVPRALLKSMLYIAALPLARSAKKSKERFNACAPQLHLNRSHTIRPSVQVG